MKEIFTTVLIRIMTSKGLNIMRKDAENIIIRIKAILNGYSGSRCRSVFTLLISIILFLSTLLFASDGYAQVAKGETSSSKSASSTKTCPPVECKKILSNCKPNLNILASDNKLSASCLSASAKGGCFNPVPVGCTVNYGGVGNRPHGAGGNSKPRYHLGNDIGAAGCANAPGKNYKFINVYAAADGTVAYNNTAGCAGRTVAINHDKKCIVSKGEHAQYKTIYRHLLQSRVSLGQSVKKGDVIGIMGGSNAAGIGKEACDNPDQKDAPGYQHSSSACSAAATRCGGASYYQIHMHFEFVDGGLASGASTSISGQSLYKPDCNDTQSLCGGCPTNAGSCNKGPKNGYADGSSGDISGDYSANGETNSANANSSESKCSYSDYISSDTCTFCKLFKTMFNTASQIALMADEGLLTPTLNLVKIGFLIWLAIYLLKQLASFNATNSGEMVKGILFQGFRVAVVALILSSTTSLFYIMDVTLNPVMMTGLKFVETVNATSECDKTADYMQGIKGYDSSKGYSGTSNATGGLSTEVGEAIVCGIKHLEDSTGLLMRLGSFSCCISWEHPFIKGLIPGLGYFTTGILLWIAGVALLLTFPWCLVDCILQLCIAAALVPCAIGAYAFKITSKYLKIVWDFFMNAMFNFVFMALVIYVINSQLQGWLGIDIDDGEPHHSIFVSFKGLAWYGMGFIRIGAITFLCYVFFDEAKSMAEKFASSPGLGGGKGIGRMVGGTMVDGSKKVGKAALHGVGKTANVAGAGINLLVGNQYRSMRNHAVGAFASKFGKNASSTVGEINGKGGTIAHEGSFRLFGRDIKVSATKGEDGKWSLTRETHKRSSSDKAFEKVLDKDGNEILDENGKVKYKARHRLFGIKTGEEEMFASTDENGNLVYQTADGKTNFTMDENGEIASYQTGFTRSLLKPWERKEKGHLKQYGTNKIVNTATSRTRETLDTRGNVTSSETKMQDFNLFNRDLVRKDGTINIDTFNQIQQNIGDSKQAAQALVAQVMEKRGMKLDSKYANREVAIDDNGVVTIKQTQKDKDGKLISTQNIQAVMIGEQMFIAAETIDSEGNTTLNESNGIFHTVQTATKDKDGKFTYSFDGGFSEYTMSKNSFMSPLNYKGQWGNNIDRDKAMAGFSKTHFDKYMAKLNVKQMNRTMSAGDYRNSGEVERLHGMIQSGKLNSLDEAKQNMTYVLDSLESGNNNPLDNNKGNNSNDDKNY